MAGMDHGQHGAAPAAEPSHPMAMEGDARALMRIDLKASAKYERRMPTVLSSLPAAIASANPSRRMQLGHNGKGNWTINGGLFDPKVAALSVQRGARETWLIENAQLSMPHPLPPTPLPTMPPAASLPPAPPPSKGLSTGTMPSGTPGDLLAPSPPMAPTPAITRITVAERALLANPGEKTERASGTGSPASTRTVSTFLPVSFTRGTLLGGLDAPTGGQSQSNPHPVVTLVPESRCDKVTFRSPM